jgi:hypothetical protein
MTTPTVLKKTQTLIQRIRTCISTRGRFWNEELDDLYSDESEDWVRNFEWYPLADDNSVWFDISQVYNSSVELDDLIINLKNAELLVIRT